ncbi:MAG: type II secretion system protein [Deltaproteobacteria bacterium]|nr:type II secretion system protein [Deltaproteobacteria bacterium]
MYCIRDSSGVTLIELMVTMVILAILSTAILPLSQVTYKRSKEIELRQNLRIIRQALDEYKRMVDEKKIPKKALASGYPEDLEILVTGVDLQGPVPFKQKFLRRIPKDPITEDGGWGLRSYFDDTDSDIWGGQDVYDVYSNTDKEALDGTLYRDW